MDNGPIASVRIWIQFQQFPQVDCLTHLQSIHGTKIMIVGISVAYSSFSTTFQPMKEQFWFGCFINETLLVVKGISPNGCIYYFEVLDNKRLQPYAFGCNYLQHVRSPPVRVVAKIGKKWLVDHYTSIAHMCDMMWLYAKEPVARLLWDPGGWF